jgi:nucleoside triphosphate pyrophosphatase
VNLPTELILASASPRRQELLRNAGIAFVAQPTDIPEDPLIGESPRACAERLAREKALAISSQHPERCVLGADTIVVVDNVMLGKPTDAADAHRMLRLLSGKTHQVITGVCLVRPRSGPVSPEPKVSDGGIFVDVRSEVTSVTFHELTDQDIQAYVQTGEPMDKAGAYAIQGRASRWIPRIEGDYFNVVGLPIALVWTMLQENR